MVAHLSNPLRELIIHWYFSLNKHPVEIAQLAQCHCNTVYKIITRFILTNNPHALPRGNACWILNDSDVRWLLSKLQANPALFLNKMQLCVTARTLP
jgi:hypothetical protein